MIPSPKTGFILTLMFLSCASQKPDAIIEKDMSRWNNQKVGVMANGGEIQKTYTEPKIEYLSFSTLSAKMDPNLSGQDLEIELKMLPQHGRIDFVPGSFDVNKLSIVRNGQTIKSCPVNSHVVEEYNPCKKPSLIGDIPITIAPYQKRCFGTEVDWPKIECELPSKLQVNDEIYIYQKSLEGVQKVYIIKEISKK